MGTEGEASGERRESRGRELALACLCHVEGFAAPERRSALELLLAEPPRGDAAGEDHFATLAGDPAHQRSLRRVPLTGRTEDGDQSPTAGGRERREEVEDGLERGGAVREVDDDAEGLAGIDPVVAWPAAAALLAALGVAVYHGVIRRVLGGPMLAQIFATFGLAIVLRSAAIRNVHDVAVALGLGADGVCPYVMVEVICVEDYDTDVSNLCSALRKGIEKVISTIGIHEVRGYARQFIR